MQAERWTLGVLMAGVASLALSDFVSPFYWSLPVVAAALRWWRGPGFALSEMQASLIGWAGFFWVALELAMGRALIVSFTDFMLILALAVAIEAPTPRNHLHRMLVGLFLVLSAAVLTDSVWYALPLAAFVWFGWRAAMLLHAMSEGEAAIPLPPARAEARIFLMMLGVGAALFFVMPRFEAHALLQPKQPKLRMSGFSDRVQLGDFARSLDPTVALRIESDALPPAAFRRWMAGRYWRVMALDRFDGRGWQRIPAIRERRWPAGASLGDARRGAAIRLYREASEHPWLALPDGFAALEHAPRALHLLPDGALRFDRAPNRRLRLDYRLLRARTPPVTPAAPVRADRDTRRTPAALKRWAARFRGTPAARLEAMAAELRDWRYDLNAPVADAAPIASFLELKRGHCELFATTLALAARELGFPARIVNGYYGGEWNDVGGFWLIRQQHAHSWVEVWRDGRWQRLDPTPPARWRMSGVRLPALDAIREAIRMGWYRYVLGFEAGDRAALLRAAARGAASLWRELQSALARALHAPGMLLAAALAAGGLALAWLAAIAWRKGRATARASGPSPKDASHKRRARLLARLDRWLIRQGAPRPAHLPVSLLPAPPGVDAARWAAFVRDWDAMIYGGARLWPVRALRARLRALARRDC